MNGSARSRRRFERGVDVPRGHSSGALDCELVADAETQERGASLEHGVSELPERDLAGALHEVSNALTVVLGWIEGARAADQNSNVRGALDVAIARARLAHRIVRRAIGAAVDGDEPRPA